MTNGTSTNTLNNLTLTSIPIAANKSCTVNTIFNSAIAYCANTTSHELANHLALSAELEAQIWSNTAFVSLLFVIFLFSYLQGYHAKDTEIAAQKKIEQKKRDVLRRQRAKAVRPLRRAIPARIGAELEKLDDDYALETEAGEGWTSVDN